MKIETGSETQTFEVITLANGQYKVFDKRTEQCVRYNNRFPVDYGTPAKPATRWQNYYSARGCCQRLQAWLDAELDRQVKAMWDADSISK